MVCGLKDEVMAAVASDESLNRIPVELLAKYALAVSVGDFEGWLFDVPRAKIAKRVIAASFPRPLTSTTRAAKQALEDAETNWLACIDEDARALIKGAHTAIHIIANALLESGSLSSEEVQQLLTQSYTQRQAA